MDSYIKRFIEVWTNSKEPEFLCYDPKHTELKEEIVKAHGYDYYTVVRSKAYNLFIKGL